MADYMTVKEAAKEWGITDRQVSGMCLAGRIQGAVKDGRNWRIPSNAEKPVDQRIKSGNYVKAAKPTNLPLPIGISDYRLASSSYYYIDKTMMIKDFLDERPLVSLFTRPRRFGKTLNMDMLRVFFEKSDEDTSIYFKYKKIWSARTGKQHISRSTKSFAMKCSGTSNYWKAISSAPMTKSICEASLAGLPAKRISPCPS